MKRYLMAIGFGAMIGCVESVSCAPERSLMDNVSVDSGSPSDADNECYIAPDPEFSPKNDYPRDNAN